MAWREHECGAAAVLSLGVCGVGVVRDGPAYLSKFQSEQGLEVREAGDQRDEEDTPSHY